MATTNWTTVTESKYPWERDALDFVRQRFPTYEPYRAWSNFEFIAEDGSINEVDLLLYTPQGFFLIEIKSHPGRLTGDAGTWTWESDGKLATMDNPLLLANLKAKKLRSLLQQQRVAQKKGQVPYIEALVFCSAPDLHCDLQGTARTHVCLRDREAVGETTAKPGILAAIMRRECPGLGATARGTHDRPMGRLIGQALDQAGIRPSLRHQKVGDYILEQQIGEGPGFQDWRGTHAQLPESKRRVRLYLVRTGATAQERQTLDRAARREFQLLETLQHPGILRALNFTGHELGPALFFEHYPLSIRLDHYLAQQKDKLSDDRRLDLLRQIAEVVRYAHDKKVVHRALCPQSILIADPTSDNPRIKIFNWQAGYRAGAGSSGVSHIISATSHVDRLVEDASTAYMAPEALSDGDNTGEHLDVFSLGAIAYHIFSGQPPAANGLELNNKLRETKGLQISSVLNGAGTALQYLVQYSSHPEVPNRIDSVVELLGCLDAVEEELTTPEHEYVEDPLLAQMGDKLPGGFQVVKRIGLGACSVALLVERAGQDFVLKVASDPEHNQRLKDEAEVLTKLHHTNLVQLSELLEIGDRTAFAMRPVFVDKTARRIETLRQRLRRDGHLLIDLLQRFGEDLLDAVNYLEDQGLPHRDIKPDNIAVGMLGRGDRLHLVLFDFSLSRTPPENIRAGTTHYLDPLLPLRTPKPRWDLHAERYAAAVTLYEMATGKTPKWGDGVTDPSHLNCEITIDAEVFDANLRDELTAFFAKALRRDPAQRFDNAEEMLRAWRNCFEGIEEPGSLSDHDDETLLPGLLAEATEDTPISELGLGTRATNVLDRANVLTVEDLLTVPMRRLSRLRGVGNKTRREIMAAVKILRERLGKPTGAKTAITEEPEPQPAATDLNTLGVDQLAQRVLRIGGREGDTAKDAMHGLLGLDPEVTDPWPSQADVARRVNVTRARVGQLLGKFQDRGSKDPAITKVRDHLAEIVTVQGGVVSAGELIEALLVERGCVEDEPKRTQLSGAVVRAAVEVERTMTDPRYLVRRDGDSVLIAQNQVLAEYASALGQVADELAIEDPLAAPNRVAQRLREVAAPSGSALSDARLVRLAVAASRNAALSSRQELYPRGMPAGRVLTLSQGALLGPKQLTVEEIRERVSSRYPGAAPLPDRPALDELLRDAGFEFRWDPLGKNGQGCYESRLRDSISVTSGSESFPRLPTSPGSAEVGEVTPEEADARQFEERLQRAVKEGAFLTLMVDPKYYERAMKELCRRFAVELVELEGLFLDALHAVANEAKVDWELVVRTDAAPGKGDWDKLMLLVGRAMTIVEQKLSAAEKTALVVYAGVLARYDRMDVLSHLSQKVGRRDGIPGLWLLLPGDHQALLDGKAVPILGPGQRARIPEGWIMNIHRSNGTM
ncbi:MAG: BREX system serine/threonine kinase PglW [Planctomycetes bacterium]|nr:BREX system serine/threonine kinase PglW [Planctomycetota bacterium]